MKCRFKKLFGRCSGNTGLSMMRPYAIPVNVSHRGSPRVYAIRMHKGGLCIAEATTYPKNPPWAQDQCNGCGRWRVHVIDAVTFEQFKRPDATTGYRAMVLCDTFCAAWHKAKDFYTELAEAIEHALRLESASVSA